MKTKTRQTKPRIESVRIERKLDNDPDTSWLGEYASHPKSGFSIDREARGNRERGQFRYFNPVFENYVERNDAGVICNDAEVRKCCGVDYQRMESLNAGQWHFLGIIAKAKIRLTPDSPSQTIRSGGLWGVESDSGKDCLDSVAKEELSALRTELESLGFTARQVTHAFANVKTPG